MRHFFIAIQFLTVIPVPRRLRMTDEDLGRSMAYFPLVGLLLGGILYGLSRAIVLVFPERIADLGCVLALVLLTGGLHLDGLADTADAFFSREDRRRMLEIMRESQIGPMGAAVIVFALLLKFELLSGLSPQVKGPTLILMPVIGRWAVVFQAAMLPYARASQGLGTAFNRYVGIREVLLSTLFTLLFVLGLRQL
ncbi:MAG: adenosylcobinamide-GDP ribazoletransferase, partial [Candidatus Latescibacteria bacterium]|nr:adenosylcobinamide-GDP ribazoletransferase [Candidatus Latescibacterota bacterium]